MAFCENCGRELGPDEVCDCQKTQAAETSNAETETKTQTEEASSTEAAAGTDTTAATEAAASTDTTPATGEATASTDTTPATEAAAASTDTTSATGAAAASTGTTPATGAAVSADTTPYGSGTGSGDKPAKKAPIALIAGGAAAAVVVVLAVLIVSLMGSGSYKTPIKTLVNLINKQSTDAFAYQELIDPIATDYTRNLYNILKKNDDVKENFSDMKSDLADFYKDIDGFKITKCDFVAAKEMKSKDLRDIQKSINNDYIDDMIEEIDEMDKGDYEDMADDLDISVGDAKKVAKATKSYLQTLRKVKVTKGYEVTIRIYGKYQGDTDKTDKMDVQVIKVNGKWRIYQASSLFRGMEFNDDLSDVKLRNLYSLINSLDLSYIY